MHSWDTPAIVLTIAAACGSSPVVPHTAATPPTPPAPVPVVTVPVPVDAGPLVELVPPRLACDPGSAVITAPAPTPTWWCARPDGTRHGPLLTVFPDDSIQITGTYKDGRLDGPWIRRHPGGGIAEEGSYAEGHKDGTWTQTSAAGTRLGSYELVRGTGVEKSWYETGTLFSERALVASIPHGPVKQYGLHGSVVSSAQHLEGKLDGAHVFGARSGVRFEETFANGVRTGKRSIWVLGTLVADEVYDWQGRLHGAYASWRRPRVLRMKGAYDAGRRTGPWVWVDRSNNKEKAGTYVDGKRDGAWSEWVEGKLALTGRYAAGKPDGEFVYYDRRARELGRFSITGGTGTTLTFHTNKQPSSRQQLVNGELNGLYQELTPRGKVVVEGSYAADLKHGMWKESAPDGAPKLEQTWKRGQLDGVVKKFVGGKLAMEATYVDGKVTGPYAEYRNGKPAVTGQFANDAKHGTWTTFNAEGLAILTATYQDGVLDGPWRQLVDGAVLEGVMADGRRAGPWTRTDGAGVVSKLTYPTP